MYPRKRTNILLKAIALLRAKYPSIELRVVGNGLEWERLHQLAAELDICANVTWLDHISDDHAMAQEWRQADVFAHPSNQETFGFVYLEAMMVGMPIVAARAGAAPEVLMDAALLIEPENPVELAAALDRFLSDPALRAEYAQRAKARAPLYTMERMADSYAQVIEQVVHEDQMNKMAGWYLEAVAAD